MTRKEGEYVIVVLTDEEEAEAVKNPKWRNECIKCGALEPEEDGQPRKYTYLVPVAIYNAAVEEDKQKEEEGK